MGKLSALIKKSAKSRTLIYDMTSYLFCKLGYGDVNLAGQISRYRGYTYLKRKYENQIGKTEFKVYENEYKPRVWVCWLQGIENAPELVQSCYASMKHYIKDMEIVALNKDNIKDYITLPDYIYEKWEKGIIPNATFSDLVRIELLIEHGGLWLDSTTLLTGKLPSYITDYDFFVYHDGEFDSQVINMGSWLMFSKPNNILLNETMALFLSYWKEHNYLKNYFLMHLLFRMVTDHYDKEWKKMPYFNQADQHILSHEIGNAYSEKRINEIKKLSSIHKLSNKYDTSNFEKDSYYSRLDSLYL